MCINSRFPISSKLILSLLFAGPSMAWSAEGLNRYDLWRTDQTSHCSGQSTYSILDFVAQLQGYCSCAGPKLAFAGAVYSGVGLEEAFMPLVSSDGKHLYIAGDDAVSLFQRDEITGALTFFDIKRNGNDGVRGLHGVNFLTLSPNGKEN